jgi:hypothetical protein
MLEKIIELVVIGVPVALVVGYLLAKYERKKINREKAVLIAELLAEWISLPPKEKAILVDYKKLHQLAWEATIWFPKDYLDKLNKCLTYQPDAPNIFELVAEARKIIFGDKEAISVKDVTWFCPEKKENQQTDKYEGRK